MNKDFTELKKQIQELYPDISFTDAELNLMTEKLVRFFMLLLPERTPEEKSAGSVQ